MGLNRPTALATEIVQQISPVCVIQTRMGDLYCRGGHGRLVWRADTIYSEEPQTVGWLGSLTAGDVLWDVGANVGLYALFAAKVTGCTVVAFEPEARNYALLIENIALNHLNDRVLASNIPLYSTHSMGVLQIHAITQGGAYNEFISGLETRRATPEPNRISQWQISTTADELVGSYGLPQPTHIKLDVDGNEPDILCGAQETLANDVCKSVLVEVEDNEQHRDMVKQLLGLGFKVMMERSNATSRRHLPHRPQVEHLLEKWHATNMIFIKS